jgi:hypothetical protein
VNLGWLTVTILFAGRCWVDAADPAIVPLWPNGAPGFEDRRHEPEQAKDYWVRNIHNPSLTVFPAPKEKANGAAMLIVPGGGHRELVFNAEGVEPAKYLNDLGVTCFVLKHRLARETNSVLAANPSEAGRPTGHAVDSQSRDGMESRYESHWRAGFFRWRRSGGDAGLQSHRRRPEGCGCD